MGRKKNLTEAELESTQTTLTIEDANQAEAEEAELLAEDSGEAAVPAEENIEVEAEAEAKTESPKPRKRRSRAKKVEEETSETIQVSTQKPNPVELDQWAAIKQLSEQVALILEKNSQIKMNHPPQVDLEAINFLKPQQPEPKTLFITKFAVAASIVAVLLSVVSLSLSQSARQAVLGSMDPMKQSGLAVNPKRSK